jgi:hypothetical protein
MEFLKSNNMFGLAQLKVDYARKVKNHTVSRSVSRLKNKHSMCDLSYSGKDRFFQANKNMAD